MKKAMPVWLRRLLLVLAAVVLGTNVYLWNAHNLAGNALPMPFGYGVAVVLSGSMEPTLSVNDLVIIRETEQVEAGDVIVFQNGDELIIHRVVAATEEEIITRGDANDNDDSPITLDAVKGKLVVAIPEIGLIARGLKQPIVILLLLFGAVALTELSFRNEQKEAAGDLEEIRAEIARLKDELKK